jgi:hypothetical protein
VQRDALAHPDQPVTLAVDGGGGPAPVVADRELYLGI